MPTKQIKRVTNAGESLDRIDDYGWESAAPGIPNRVKRDFDLRDKNRWFAKVEDQGQEGSCVGRAIADALWFHWLKAGIVKSTSRRYRPSYRYIWIASKEMDNAVSEPTTMIPTAGTFIKCGLSILRKFGCPMKSVLPDSGKPTRLSRADFMQRAALGKIKSYHSVNPHAEGLDSEAITYWIKNQGPVITRLSPDRQFMSAKGKNQVLDNYRYGSNIGGHALLVIGYRRVNGHRQYLLKNTYGSRWGYRGCVWVAEEYARAALTESYGILFQ